jgi:hypothetical protein
MWAAISFKHEAFGSREQSEEGKLEKGEAISVNL